MAQDTSSYQDVLKDYYGPGITELLPQKVPLLSMFQEQSAKDYGGAGVVFPLHLGRNSGTAWGAEAGALPTAGKQQYATVRIPMRYGYTRITVTAQLMELSQSAKGAFAPAWEQEMKGSINDLANQRGRIIFGTGSGVLAFINGAASSTTQTLDNPGGFVNANNGSRFISVGDIITCVNPATGALRASTITTVTAVAAAGTTITVSPSISTTDNDYVVKAANTTITDVSDSSYGKEPMGVGGLNDDGTNVATLHNVNRTTYPLYGSYVATGVGAWSADLIQKGIDVADQRGTGSIKQLVMHHSARRAYLAAMDSNRRYTGAELMTPDGGTRAARDATGARLAFGSIPVQEDKYAPYGTVHGLDTDGFERYVAKSGEWITEGSGNMMFLVGTGATLTHQYEAVYTIWDNFNLTAPSNCFRLDGLTVTLVVVHVD
jgi:hypothetical protein